jgi:geranylgeranyl pyrophosphate synthase
LRAAAVGHRTLSQGQGAELSWVRSPEPLASLQVLDIFRKKTAPAFEVALRFGAALAGAGREIDDVLAKYSEALGIAYQIRDDLEDLQASESIRVLNLRPSLPLATAYERAKAHDERIFALLGRVWRRDVDPGLTLKELEPALERVGAAERCQRLLESYKEEAIRSLAVLQNASLKGLLRRVVGKIFNDLEVKGWCSEFEARNATSRPAGAEVAG